MLAAETQAFRRGWDSSLMNISVRDAYSTGTVAGLRKGLLVGTPRGPGRLCGTTNGRFRYYDRDGKRRATKTLSWISTEFNIRNGGRPFPRRLNATVPGPRTYGSITPENLGSQSCLSPQISMYR